MSTEFDTMEQASRSGINMGDLPSFIGYTLRRAQLVIFDDFIRTLEEVGLKPATFGVLIIIDNNPGLNQSEVSAALGIQRTNFVALVDGLEQRGLAERRPSETDRRSHALYLTAAGRGLLNRAMSLQQRHEAHLAERLGPGGREQLLSLLEKLQPGS
jgi:DNA-binding MarR family transcriptional regulator